MNTVAEMFKSLQDGTALTGLHTGLTDVAFDFVQSGLVWTADAAGSTRNASMTSGILRINGRRYSVSAVTARTFTASKDTYVDILANSDGTATVVYTEATNNAASPALAGNSVRIAIIVTGAGNIAAASSINQGQEDRVLPIASSIAYSVTDSLGNLICPRDPTRKLLGYRQITSTFTGSSATPAQITGLSVPIIIPTGRKIKVCLDGPDVQASVANNTVYRSLYVGAVGGTKIQEANVYITANSGRAAVAVSQITTQSGSVTINAGYSVSGGNAVFEAGSTIPLCLWVELV
jgi:hypothetical protein